MVSQRWTRWVAIGLVVLVALGGSVIGALSLADHGSTPASAPSPRSQALGETQVVLPRQPLGWNPVEDERVSTARGQAEEFGKGFGARTVYAEYARGDHSLAVTGIMPGAGTDLRQALEDSPGGAIAHQFVNVGLGEGTPFASGVDGVSLRCGQPTAGSLACIWADQSVLTLMSWRLGQDAGLAAAAKLTAGLIPAFRQPA
jgi:hypothetical protein